MEHELSMPDESLNQTNLKCFVADKIALEDSSLSIELDDFERLQGTVNPFLISKRLQVKKP